MNPLQKAFNDVKSIGYKSGTKFEQDVFSHFQKYLKDYDKKYLVVYQPNGTQKSPDIRIIMKDGSKIDIECKSSIGDSAMWNGGIPKEEYFYIFTSKKFNDTTYLKGSSIITEDNQKALKIVKERCNEVRDLLNEELKDLLGSWTVGYLREMHYQVKIEKKWITHRDRKKREDEVINCMSVYL